MAATLSRRVMPIFVDGRRLPGSLTRFLPVYDLNCTRSDLLQDAGIDLRVLHDGPPAQGIRLIGRTLRLTATIADHQFPEPRLSFMAPLAGLLQRRMKRASTTLGCLRETTMGPQEKNGHWVGITDAAVGGIRQTPFSSVPSGHNKEAIRRL